MTVAVASYARYAACDTSCPPSTCSVTALYPRSFRFMRMNLGFLLCVNNHRLIIHLFYLQCSHLLVDIKIAITEIPIPIMAIIIIIFSFLLLLFQFLNAEVYLIQFQYLLFLLFQNTFFLHLSEMHQCDMLLSRQLAKICHERLQYTLRSKLD